MDNPNLLKCLVLARNTPPLSFSLPLFIYLPSFLPLSSLPFFFLLYIYIYIYIYIYLLLHPSLFIFPSLPLLLSSSLPLPFPSHTHSSLQLSRLSSFRHALSLNPILHDTSYSSIFLSLSILSSIFIPLSLFLHRSPFPSLFMLFHYTHNNIF